MEKVAPQPQRAIGPCAADAGVIRPLPKVEALVSEYLEGDGRPAQRAAELLRNADSPRRLLTKKALQLGRDAFVLVTAAVAASAELLDKERDRARREVSRVDVEVREIVEQLEKGKHVRRVLCGGRAGGRVAIHGVRRVCAHTLPPGDIRLMKTEEPERASERSGITRGPPAQVATPAGGMRVQHAGGRFILAGSDKAASCLLTFATLARHTCVSRRRAPAA